MDDLLTRYRKKMAFAANNSNVNKNENTVVNKPLDLAKKNIEVKPTYESKEIRNKWDLPVFDVDDSKRNLLNIKPESSANSSSESVDDKYISWRDELDEQIKHDKFDRLMQSLQPTIDYALASNNAKDDPYIEAKAKILASDAIRKFDPQYGATLPTYLSSQLKKLTRVVRDTRSPIRIPENVFYDIQNLKESEKQLTDNLGREPDLQELADYMRVPVSKIEKIRNQQIKQVSENQYFNSASAKSDEDTPSNLSEVGMIMPDNIREALDYTYAGLDHREKKILEWSTGFGGSPILSPADIAKKLNISQSQVSRLTAKIAVQVEENLKAIEDTQ